VRATAVDAGVTVLAHSLAAEVVALGAAKRVCAADGGLTVQFGASIKADSVARVTITAPSIFGVSSTVTLRVHVSADNTGGVGGAVGAASNIIRAGGADLVGSVDAGSVAVPTGAGVTGARASQHVREATNTTGTDGVGAHRLGKRSQGEVVLVEVIIGVP
jgi:hypothetical protein